ncbi:MAG TPA: cysteine--tRNA ligase [Methanomicrobia archaeon]|nr:cysteine--tRNA ligase [Methanomicrobia archaeon]
MTIRIYNTLTRKKTPFVPREGGGNGMYIRLFVCGPTVYDYSHIGHARTYVAFDVIVRYLRYRGYEVYYLQNITDIDDKIIARARETGMNCQELAGTFTRAYLEDMRALRVTSVRKYAPATEYIDAIVGQVQQLLELGYAYELDDGYYYDVSRFQEYGKLSGRTLEDAEDTVSRIDDARGKRNKADFCLWKRFKPGEPYWESELGKGRPGWHIEDTAITETEFGPTYDAHGGAQDLIFPHHEAEIAQMEAISGQKPMVNYWLHTGFLKVGGRKMSKSLGNFITIREALQSWDVDTLRLMLISTHYRSPINFTETAMTESRDRLRYIREARKAGVKAGDMKPWIARFVAAMDEDFNTPSVVALLFELAKQMHKTGEDLTPALDEIGEVLGIDFHPPVDQLPHELLAMIKHREELRRQKRWDEADHLRTELEKRGILVKDTPEGTEWTVDRPESRSK